MLNKYRLGDSIIETTEQRYKTKFKDMGYVPYIEQKEVKKKSTKKTNNK